MKCNMGECYWNMWMPKSKMFSGEESKVCTSENFIEHCDPNNDYTLTPNDEKCAGYWPYEVACGHKKDKGERKMELTLKFDKVIIKDEYTNMDSVKENELIVGELNGKKAVIQCISDEQWNDIVSQAKWRNEYECTNYRT